MALVLCLLALALRLYRLDAQSLWYDEGVTAYLSTLSLPELTAWTADDIQPPFYYYLIWLWVRLAGAGEFALRFPSVLAGVLTVPALGMLAWRLTGSRWAGLAAALLAAISPLHLWYAQEARNYTWVTFLCLGGSLQLWLALAAGDEQPRRDWLPYLGWMVPAVYTHYFAFFVLLFHGVFALAWGVARQGRWARPLAAVLGVILAYTPWLPFLLQRWQADVSYWPGTLKLGEAARHVILSFLAGETMLEPVAMWFLAPYLVFLALAFSIWGWAAWKNPSKGWGLAFCVLYGVVPVAAILALAYQVPKFNPRYAMLASPATVLLLAGAWGKGGDGKEGGGVARWVAPGLAGAGLAFVVGVSAYADWGLYFDPAFTKPDFRGVTHYLRREVGPQEAVVLVSGHMYPVFDYYWPDSDRTLVPSSRILDARHPLGWDVASALNEAVHGKSGVWLVLWQDEVVDPSGMVPYMLERWGDPLPTERTFWHVGVRHYAWHPWQRIPEEPAIEHPFSVDFGGVLQFLGFDQPEPGRIVAYWQALQPIPSDYKVSLRLTDAEGLEWGRLDRRPGAYTYPTFRWEPGKVALGDYALPALPGTPPGLYQLRLGVYSESEPEGLDVLDPGGAPAGKQAHVGPVEVGLPQKSPTLEDLQVPVLAPEGLVPGEVRWLGYGLEPRQGRAGEYLHLTLFWAIGEAPEPGLSVQVAWQRDGHTLAVGELPLAGEGRDPADWPVGFPFRTQHRLRIPLDAEEGPVQLQAGVARHGTLLSAEPLKLGTVEILPTERDFRMPQPQVPVQARFGEGILLLGADLPLQALAPGASFEVILYWQAEATTDRSYTAFVHLLDAEGKVVAQVNQVPAFGNRPTHTWLPGEVLRERYTLTLPADAGPGTYRLEVGWYDAARPSLPRLAVEDAEESTLGDRVLLGPVRVRR
ncbi:MAG: glycosyltransferase family 39 protein [Anaerolineae bacterium]